jgi:hypothetical protein
MVGGLIGWIRERYGDDLYRRALAQLPEAERASFQRAIPSLGWYQLTAWERLLAAVRAEARAATGEDEAAFDRRLIREAGGRMAKTLYKFLLSWFQPTALIQRVPGVILRSLEPSQAEVRENAAGRALLRFSGPADMYPYTRRYLPLAIPFVLEMAGAVDIDTAFTRDAADAGGFELEQRLTYRLP